MDYRWISLHMVVIFYTFVQNGECMKFYFGMAPTVSDQHTTLGTLLFNNNQSMYMLNNQEMWDFRNIMSVCKDISASTVVYGLSVTPCYPEADPGLMFTKYLKLPSLSITQTCSVNNSYHQILPQMYRSPWSTYAIRRRMNIPDPSVVIGDIALKEAWVECIIIADETKGVFPELDHLMSFLGYTGVRLSLFTVRSDRDIYNVMFKINAWKSAEYTVPHILLCSVNNTLKVLERASKLGMRRTEYMWLVYNGGSARDILPHLRPSDNVALVSANHEAIHKQTVDMSQNIEILNQHIEKTVKDYKEPPNNAKRRCKSTISDTLRSQISSQINDYTLQLHNLTAEAVYEVQSSITRKSGVPEMERVATWDINDALSLPASLFPNAFNGFNQRVFTVCSVEKRYDEDGNVTWVGLSFQLLDELAKELNFRYKVVEPPDNQWGLLANSSNGTFWTGMIGQVVRKVQTKLLAIYIVVEPKDGQWGIEDGNGNWTGMIGEVIRKEVDFAAAGFSITATRDEVVDFVSPYFHDQSVVVMRRPDEKNRLLLYMFPFHWEVWVGTIAAIALCGPLLWLFTYFSPYYKASGNPWNGKRGLFSIQNNMMYIFGAFLQQGGVFLPVAQSGRVLVAFYWVFCIVIVATYTGNLIAFLAVSTVDMPFDTLSKMVQQDGLQWGTATGVALVMLFRDANFEPYTKVYAGMDPVNSYSEGLRRVKEENYAFISEKSWYQAEAANDKECVLAMMKEEFYPTSYGWALQTGAPYLSLFSDKINKIRESGLLEKWIQDWTPKNIHCKGLGPITQAKVATVIDFQGALFLLVLGVGIGILFLLFEIGYNSVISVLRKSRNLSNADTSTQNGSIRNVGDSHGMTQINSTSSGLDLLNSARV